MRKTFFLFVLLVTLGAGCAPAQPSVPQDQPVPLDGVAPHANVGNCTKSGGKIVDGDCQCPDDYASDPAGFCLDAKGQPGGEMAPK